MPLYQYQCVDCLIIDTRLAGLDDHSALCVNCGSLMWRQDEDLFDGYFAPSPDCPWCGQKQPGTSKICLRHAADLREQIAVMKNVARGQTPHHDRRQYGNRKA